MFSKPLPCLLFLIACCTTNAIQLKAQAKKIIAYDVKTKSKSIWNPTHVNTSVSNDQTPSFKGLLNSNTTNLPLAKPTANLIESTTFTQKTLVQNTYNVTDYPIRTTIKLIIEDEGELFHSCSAVMISSRHALTAAHCFIDAANPNEVLFDNILAYAMFDNGEQQDELNSAQVQKIYFFKDWESFNGEDMMILELDAPIGEKTGWLGIGFNNDNTFFENNNFHKFSYPGEQIFEDETAYNGDTLYYTYGQLGFRQNSTYNDVMLSVPDYNEARPGESGSSIIYTNNEDEYTTYGVLNYLSDFKHSRIQPWQFYNIEAIIRESTRPIEPPQVNHTLFEVFPNPTVDFVNIKFKDLTQEYTVIVYDSKGLKVDFVDIPKGQLNARIDLSNKPSGMYSINVYDGNKMIANQVMKTES